MVAGELAFYEVIKKRRTVRDWHYIIVRDKEVAKELLSAIPRGITDEDMDKLIVLHWNGQTKEGRETCQTG